MAETTTALTATIKPMIRSFDREEGALLPFGSSMRALALNSVVGPVPSPVTKVVLTSGAMVEFVEGVFVEFVVVRRGGVGGGARPVGSETDTPGNRGVGEGANGVGATVGAGTGGADVGAGTGGNVDVATVGAGTGAGTGADKVGVATVGAGTGAGNVGAATVGAGNVGAATVGTGTGAVNVGTGTGATVGAGTGATVGAGTGANVGAGTGANVGAGTGADVGGGIVGTGACVGTVLPPTPIE
mmetsp:Transcript_8918/g.22506  ORF Transcript_8918/g.22506 Transcript_8918/m.22506 type:complete len:243 (+) Transcript_8918:436-1164(+)